MLYSFLFFFFSHFVVVDVIVLIIKVVIFRLKKGLKLFVFGSPNAKFNPPHNTTEGNHMDNSKHLTQVSHAHAFLFSIHVSMDYYVHL